MCQLRTGKSDWWGLTHPGISPHLLASLAATSLVWAPQLPLSVSYLVSWHLAAHKVLPFSLLCTKPLHTKSPLVPLSSDIRGHVNILGMCHRLGLEEVIVCCHLSLVNKSRLATRAKKLALGDCYCFHILLQREVLLGARLEVKKIWDGERIWLTGVKTQKSLTSNSTLSFYITNVGMRGVSPCGWMAAAHLALVWAGLGPQLEPGWQCANSF